MSNLVLNDDSVMCQDCYDEEYTDLTIATPYETIMYCHGGLSDERPFRPHFKGFVHEDCAEKYHGRIDYENQHPEELST